MKDIVKAASCLLQRGLRVIEPVVVLSAVEGGVGAPKREEVLDGRPGEREAACPAGVANHVLLLAEVALQVMKDGAALLNVRLGSALEQLGLDVGVAAVVPLAVGVEADERGTRG